MTVELTSVICAATQPKVGVAPRTGSDVSSRIGSWTKSEQIALEESPERSAFRKILSKRLSRPRSETLRGRLRRVQRIVELPLHRKVITRICKLDFDGLKRLSNFVETIRDCLVFSTPDISNRTAEFNKVLVWAYSVGVYRIDTGTSQWKKFSSLLKWFALKSETPKPENPRDFPGFGDQNFEDFPSFWSNLCPWMKSISRDGAKSKLDLTRVAHFTSSRGLPAGDAKTRVRSLQKHRNTLSSVHDQSEERKDLLFELSRLIGKKLKSESKYYSNAHLSLTSSSSFDSIVKEGGRAKEISEKFRIWMEAVPRKTREGTTLLGQESTELCGFPRWMTVGRKDYNDFIKALPHDDEGAIHPCVEAGESRQDTFFDFENFKYEDPIYALDNATGYQLHQWATETMLDLDILSGDKHNPDTIRVNPDSSPLIRRSCIGEPGAKSRVITVAEACITIFLQPFSHHLTGWLHTHPSATAGLTRAAQGYEYVKALHRKVHPPMAQLDLKILSSDLTTATDFCVHDYSQAMLNGLCHGLEDNPRYHSLSSKLLCSPRRVVDGEDNVWTTHRGILMGDPGAKAVLTMHNLCAELEAFLRYRSSDLSISELLRRTKAMKEIPSTWWRHFACSGDDHAAIGPDEYLGFITKAHSANGMSVSWPQNFVSKIGGVYCEEFFFIRGYSSRELFLGKNLWQLGYAKHAHVDAIKLRLISPCSKEHEGKDEPNPGIGKAHQISRVLAWIEKPIDALRKWVSWRFIDRFSGFLPGSVEQYLPVSLGGLEAPGWHLDPLEIIESLLELPFSHLSMIEKLLSSKTTHLDRRVLSSFASNTRARGIEADLIADQVRLFLTNVELTKAIDVNEIQSVIAVDPDEFLNWNSRKKFHAAKAAGFVSINDAINLIERPYIFRDLLFPDMSEKHGYKPSISPAYSIKSWSLRKRRFHNQLDLQVPEGDVSHLSSDNATRIATCIVSGLLLEVPPSNLLIPKAVVEVESRPQLRTPY
jgi:hypothetical protein